MKMYENILLEVVLLDGEFESIITQSLPGDNNADLDDIFGGNPYNEGKLNTPGI